MVMATKALILVQQADRMAVLVMLVRVVPLEQVQVVERRSVVLEEMVPNTMRLTVLVVVVVDTELQSQQPSLLVVTEDFMVQVEEVLTLSMVLPLYLLLAELVRKV
jgi:hypothetical protein